jgi:hypothetical protein
MNLTQPIREATAPMNTNSIKAGLGRLALALCLAMPLAGTAAEQRTFTTAESAVDALASALQANDESALVSIFGDKYRDLVGTGDTAADAARRSRIASALRTYRVLEERGADRRVLLIGEQAWPFAIPIVREAGSWRFASELGADELRNRRIGANERYAIHVMRAYVDAQRQYASRDRDGDGVLQYAARIPSTPGKQDGLYWPADAAKGEEPSPFGPLIAEGAAQGTTAREGEPYRGYRYRILKAQGQHAAGGAYGYVINGRMIAGFALVAYPADYGSSGVMTFIVNHNGRVYQKNLGSGTAGIASKMATFDPGPGWSEVTP